MDDFANGVMSQIPPGTLIERLGIEATEVTADRAVGTMPVAGNTQPYGLLHGGATAALAETLGSLAAMAHAHPDGIAVGVDLSITHHRVAREGRVTGVATALYRGSTVATYAIDVTDSEGKRIATARLTCAIRPQPAGD
jgi:1,4-dihydroxy-2-naphthoyl-CoA hydrolase